MLYVYIIMYDVFVYFDIFYLVNSTEQSIVTELCNYCSR